jgi:hypothetical protein
MFERRTACALRKFFRSRSRTPRSFRAKSKDQQVANEALMKVAKVCSLGSMSHALCAVGGEYRRNM